MTYQNQSPATPVAPGKSKESAEPGLVESIFLLRSFVTPMLIEWVHLLGMVGILLTGFGSLASHAKQAVDTNPYGQFGGMPGYSPYSGAMGLLGGGNPLVTIIWMVAALIAWRLTCEVTILLFRIHSELRGIREELK